MPRQILTPGPEHPITIEAHCGRVTVRVGKTLIADTRDALILREHGYRPVYYIPRAAIDPALIARTDTGTYCPYKGEATYYAVHVGESTVADAAWSYEQPHPAVAAIAGHLAFYPQHAEIGEQ